MVPLNFSAVDLIRRIRASLTFSAPIALPIALGRTRSHAPGPRLEVSLSVRTGSPWGVTDGARTRDLRSHNPPTDVAQCSLTGRRADI